MTTLMDERLSPEHLNHLEAESAITREVITSRGYQTMNSSRSLPLIFPEIQRKNLSIPGLLLPIYDTLGEIRTYQYRPDHPKPDIKTGKATKYLNPAGGETCLDIPAACRPFLLDVEADLWITEGSKKVDSAVSNGIPSTIGLLGVSMWQREGVVLPDWKDIALKGRKVVIAFDSDVMTKASVRAQLDGLAAYLRYYRARVVYCLIPDLPDGSKCGLDDWFARGGTRQDLEALIVDTMPARDDEWHPPVPLDDSIGPPFPLDRLPGDLKTFVAALASGYQVDPGLPAVMALGGLSAAGRGIYVVEVPDADWREPVIAQVVAVLPSAERKTAIVNEIRAPIEATERKLQTHDRPVVLAWESERRVKQKQLDQAEAAAGKNDSDSDLARQEAVEALARHDGTRPFITTLLLSDATPEAIVSTLCEQRGAVAILDDEGQFVANMLPRYGKNLGPSFEYVLHGHSHGPVRVTRKTSADLYTPRAALTYCVACQPFVIEHMGSISGFRDRGGVARIWPAFLASRVGTRTLKAPRVAPELRKKWHDTIAGLLTHQPPRQVDAGGFPLPVSLVLDVNANSLFRGFWEEWECTQLVPGGRFGDDHHLKAWGGKYAGLVLRVAGLLHLSIHKHPEGHLISGDTMTRAIAIGEYFAAHALILHRVMEGGTGNADARVVLTALMDLAKESSSRVTRRDLHQKLRGRPRFALSESLTKPLALLEDFGWIRRIRQTGERGGRPSELIEITPYSGAQNPQNPDFPVRLTMSRGSSEGFEGMSMSLQPEPATIVPFPNHLPPSGIAGDYSEVI